MPVTTGNANVTHAFQTKVATGYLTPVTVNFAINNSVNYTVSGTGDGQVDLPFGMPVTLTGAAQTFDLTAMTDQIGVVRNFARVREFVIYNTDTTAGHQVNIYRASSNGWNFLPTATSPMVLTIDGGQILLRDPHSTGSGVGLVTSTNSRTFTLDPGANTVTVNILIMGCSAVS
jgi:hypothetical protein